MRRIGQQRFERAEAEQLVEDVADQRLALDEAERHGLGLVVDHRDDQRADLGLGVLAADAAEAVQIQPVEQVVMNAALELLILRMPRVDADAASGRPSRRFQPVCGDRVSHDLCLVPRRAARRAVPAARARRRLRVDESREIDRHLLEGGRQLVVVLQRERPSGVHRLRREPIVARQHVRHRLADRARDVVPSDVRPGVEPREDRLLMLRVAVAPAQRGRDPRRVAHGRRLLDRLVDNLRGAIEGVERRAIVARDVDDDVAEEARGAFEQEPARVRACGRRSPWRDPARRAGAVRRPSASPGS